MVYTQEPKHLRNRWQKKTVITAREPDNLPREKNSGGERNSASRRKPGPEPPLPSPHIHTGHKPAGRQIHRYRSTCEPLAKENSDRDPETRQPPPGEKLQRGKVIPPRGGRRARAATTVTPHYTQVGQLQPKTIRANAHSLPAYMKRNNL